MVKTPIAYNTGSAISGTLQVGNLAIGTTIQDYSGEYGGVTWWMSPDEEVGYVIAAPYPDNDQPTPIPGISASVGFYQSALLTNESFLVVANYVGSMYGQPPFTTTNDAQTWLTDNGFWTSYSGSSETYFILFQDGNIMTAQNGDSIEIQY